MSKKHFEALADALAMVRPSLDNGCQNAAWQRDVNAVADVCARFNGNFDRGRFLDACRTRFAA